jgi:septum formation protein
MNYEPLILASQSPRRRELLAQLGLQFAVLPSRAKERFGKGTPAAQARRLATEKAQEVVARLRARALRRGEGAEGWVLGADTIVVKSGRLMGKPKSAADAARMLGLLQGATHRVITGLALLPLAEGKPWIAHESTRVTFRRLSRDEIAGYVASGEPMDKAGAYGIQGRAGAFVSRISGDYFNVVGLPLAKLAVKFNSAKP